MWGCLGVKKEGEEDKDADVPDRGELLTRGVLGKQTQEEGEERSCRRSSRGKEGEE